MLFCTQSSSLPTSPQKWYLKALCPNIGWKAKYVSIEAEHKYCGKIWLQEREEVKN